MQPSQGSIPQVDALLASLPCPRCGTPGPHRVGPGAGPHAARLVCGACGRWLRWLPRLRPTQEGQP
jgi:hypothetical protein